MNMSIEQAMSERRMWFDYLVKLNDRSIQAQQVSGATTWVLLGVIAAIAYRGVPQIPTLLAVKGGTSAAGVALACQLNAAFLLGMGIYFLFTSQDAEKRLMPEVGKRIQALVFWLWSVIALFFTIVQAYLAYVSPTVYLRVYLGFFAFFWAMNLQKSVVAELQKVKKEKKQGIKLPDFSGTSSGEGLMWFLATLPLGLWSLVVLILHLRSFAWNDSLLILGTASHVAVVIGISMFLLARAALANQLRWHLDLERRIVLEKLAPDDTAKQFVTHSLGRSIGDWVSDFAHDEERSQFAFEAALDSTSVAVLEGNCEAGAAALLQIDSAKKGIVDSIRKTQALWKGLQQLRITPEQSQLIINVIEDFGKRRERRNASLQREKLLRAEVEQLQQQCRPPATGV